MSVFRYPLLVTLYISIIVMTTFFFCLFQSGHGVILRRLHCLHLFMCTWYSTVVMAHQPQQYTLVSGMC
jgi:hypothetical protein